MTKYTHIPEAQSAVHPINKYLFIYRREALLNVDEEQTIEDELVIRLLYGEVFPLDINNFYLMIRRDTRCLTDGTPARSKTFDTWVV